MRTFTLIKGFALFLSINFNAACQSDHSALTGSDSTTVKNDVTTFANSISSDISKNGPKAWLNYFENNPNFFMASDGELAFKDHQTAQTFIENTLIKSIGKIKLRWENLRVDPLTPNIASIGANFHEDITDTKGMTLSIDGYFTSMAVLDHQKWELRNAHWSIKHPDKN